MVQKCVGVRGQLGGVVSPLPHHDLSVLERAQVCAVCAFALSHFTGLFFSVFFPKDLFLIMCMCACV